MALPPFEPEAAVGVLRSKGGYRAFSVRPSIQIWQQISLKRDLSKVHPVFRDRSISDSTAVRIASVWRRVLADRANYGKDPSLYLDTSMFGFYVAFAPDETLSAHVTGWGRRTKQLILLTESLLSYTTHKSDEKELLKVLSTAETKLRI